MEKLRYEAIMEYKITAEVDESLWDEERVNEFSEFMHDITCGADVIPHVIHNVIMFGGNKLVEGVGYVTVNGINVGDYDEKISEECIDRSIKINMNDPFPDIEKL